MSSPATAARDQRSKPPSQENDDALDLAPHLRSKLEEFRNQVWSVKIAEGALAGIVGLCLSYLLVFALDRFIDTPGWARGLILAAGAAVPGLGIPLRWHNWVWKQRTLEQVARLIRKSHPRLGDQLLGIVQLAREQSPTNPETHSNQSQSLVAAAMRQVDERVKDADFNDAVPKNRYGFWMGTTIAVLAVAALALVIVSSAAQNAMARWLTPWKAVDRFTFAKIEPVPQQLIVPYAEKFDFGTQLKASTEWKPEQASLRLPGKTKLRSERDAARDDYAFDIPPQKEEAALRLRVGDAIEKVHIQPVTRPELTDLSALVNLPDYLFYTDQTKIPVRGGSVSILKGAETSFVGTTSRELTDAWVNGEKVTTSENQFSTPANKVTHSQNHQMEWHDIHGLKAKTPLEVRVNAVEDQAPNIFAKRTSKEQVVLASEVVAFDISAGDDYGLRKMGLEWVGTSGADSADKGEKIVTAGYPQLRENESRGTFSAAVEGVKPQTLQIRAFAEDYLPNRPRSYSSMFVLHVMNPEDHADWMTTQFSKWFRHAREVYEKEQQLYEGNRELRKLSAQQLDQPENRRALEKQASAESNNARRLDSLTKSGRDLVRQAAKNDEFDAERLESWATMMRSLDEIAKNRMPSVSDLLQRAAKAPGNQSASGQQGKEKDEKQEPGKSSPSSPSVKNDKSETQKSSNQPKSNQEQSKIPQAPSITNRESSFGEKQQAQEKGENAEKKKASPGSLRLPSTTLGPAPDNGEGDKKEEDEGENEPESPAQKNLDEAVKKQEELLKEFAKISDQLQEILSSLESSTFVKRLKAASRRQMEVATNLNETLSGGFGMPQSRVASELRKVGEELSLIEAEESETVYTIQTDLDAYFQRKQDVVFKNVLDQMREESVVSRLKEISEEVSVNLNGRSLVSAEYWADTLDRWAEELVAATSCKACKGGSKESLPPEIVLEVMKILRDEMDLRDQTREAEAIRIALIPDEFASKAKPLEEKQAALRKRTDRVIGEIEAFPDAESHFGKEIKLLTQVSDIMRQARGILSRPDTGPEAIAAETEVIELLLQTKRQKPNSGGGGGGSSPGGGASSGQAASLADINLTGGVEVIPGQDSPRDVDQSTGKAGRELPEEFRHGLDQYFNTLESN